MNHWMNVLSTNVRLAEVVLPTMTCGMRRRMRSVIGYLRTTRSSRDDAPRKEVSKTSLRYGGRTNGRLPLPKIVVECTKSCTVALGARQHLQLFPRPRVLLLLVHLPRVRVLMLAVLVL